jgi:signal transduction histidine kinase
LKKIYFTLITIFIFSCNQERNKINIKSEFLPTKFDGFNLSQKNIFLRKLLDSILKLENDSLKTQYLFDVSNKSYYIKNFRLSIIASKSALLTSLKLNDSTNVGRALYYIGDCYLEYKKDSAYYYYKESEKIFRKIKNNDRLAKVLYNKAYLLYYEGNYIESEIEVAKALILLRNEKNLLYQYRCYSLQGSNHLELGEYDKALEYFNLSASILKQMKKEDLDKDAFYDYEITNTIDLCTAYDKKEEYSKSVKLLKEVIKKGSFKNYSKLHYTVFGNIAYSLMKNNQYEESRKYFVESIKLANDNNDKLGYLYKIIDFGEYHLATKDTLKARELFNEALLLSKKLNNGKEILKSLDLLSVADKPNATNYKSEYIRINDSIIKKQRENREKFARIEYETGKVVEENKVLTTKNLLLLLGLMISVLAILVVIIIKNKITRNKELKLIQLKEKADKELLNLTKEFQSAVIEARIEEQNRISKELHDGVVNQIYGIRMILGSLNSKDDEETQKKRFSYIKELQKLESDIRTLSHELTTDFSMSTGEFPFLIEQLIVKNNEIGYTNFSYTIQSSIDWVQYSSIVKINLYRIIQELLLNVNKYAEAKNCTLEIYELNQQLVIVLKDDGKGFISTTETSGIGLKNCKKRANTINAQIDIQSTIKVGTTITLKL